VSGVARGGVEAGVEACDQCLRRAWLVGSLSAQIERSLTDLPRQRSRELLALDDAGLATAIARGRAAQFLERARERDPSRLRAAIAGSHSWACCRHHHLYPEALRDLSDSPAILFGRGDASRLAELGRDAAVTIVGARRPSSYGREMATRLGRELATAGLAVVSGMALGIDSCSHAGVLEAEGLTVAVLGSGPDLPHPQRMRALYDRIVDRGLILTELPPGTAPRRWTFPARNRIMAALGAMTIVVEARARSGSLITSTIADDLGRDVGAVPGQVGSSPAEGTNNLIRTGAHLIRGGPDALDSVLGTGVAEKRVSGRNAPELDPELSDALGAVERGASTHDAISCEAGLEPGAAATALTRLELLGMVACDSAGRYRRTTVAADVA